MRLNYNGKTIGTITTNHSMSVEDCIELLEVDTEKYSEIELFSMDYLDEYNNEAIDLIYEGKEWGELAIAEKEYFMIIARTTEREGDCIVYFEGLSISISGRAVIGPDEDTIEIKDTAEFYKPMV